MVRAALALALLFVAASELSELPEDCEDSECSLSLRQLRGEQTLASVAAHQADPFTEPAGIDDSVDEPVTPKKPKAPVVEADYDWGNMTQEAWEEKQGGSCCFSADDPNNVCGTCFPTAVASFRNNCARKSTCGSCGGSWCEPKCVMGAADPNDKCGTAFETGTAKSDSYCGKSAKNCASCNGEWCKRGVTKKAPKVESKVTSVSAVSNVQGFCCYRGNGLAKNMCGGCADVSQDAACASSTGCGSCGGTWCPGPRCIKAFKDKADPCNTAYGHDSVASAEEYCAGSEDHCSSCHGVLCAAYNISFVTGEKFDPSKPLKMPSSDDDDDIEDVADPGSAETISELFPDGLP